MQSYEGPAGSGNFPGQPWSSYRSDVDKKPCGDRLTELLTPTREAQYFEDSWKSGRSKEHKHCPFLRLVEKRLDPNEWFVDVDGKRQLHNGAHYPLTVWTKSAGKRSQKLHDRRQQNRWDPQTGKAKTYHRGDMPSLGRTR